MACPEGLEPPTYCLEGNCSIQLSYGQTNGAHNKVRIILRACIRETLSVLLCRGVMGHGCAFWRCENHQPKPQPIYQYSD